MKPTLGFQALVRVRFGDCDPMGHLNNANYLTILEQTAFDAAAGQGFDRFQLNDEYGAAFVVRKHEITYRQPARENEWLLVRSWGIDVRAARAWREYTVSKFVGDASRITLGEVAFDDLVSIEKRDLVVSAVTEFAFVNVTTGHPSRVPTAFTDAFFEADA